MPATIRAGYHEGEGSRRNGGAGGDTKEVIFSSMGELTVKARSAMREATTTRGGSYTSRGGGLTVKARSAMAAHSFGVGTRSDRTCAGVREGGAICSSGPHINSTHLLHTFVDTNHHFCIPGSPENLRMNLQLQEAHIAAVISGMTPQTLVAPSLPPTSCCLAASEMLAVATSWSMPVVTP